MSSATEKTLAILEMMALHPEGVQVSTLARHLDMPVSGVHRQLRELARLGYVSQSQDQGVYALTIKLAAMGLGFLGRSGVTDIAQPILDRLASLSGELVRLSVRDSGGLTWVAVAQGATVGLRYDPGREQGMRVHPASTAGGQALLATMTDEEVLSLVGETGLTAPNLPATSNAPRSIDQLMRAIEATRKRGFSIAIDSYIEGMSAMAVPVRSGGFADGPVIGVLSIAGPAVRFPVDRMDELAPALFAASEEIGQAAPASKFFAHHLFGEGAQ